MVERREYSSAAMMARARPLDTARCVTHVAGEYAAAADDARQSNKVEDMVRSVTCALKQLSTIYYQLSTIY